MQPGLLHIRTCTLEELHVLQSLSIQTFRETYEAVNTPENMVMYIENDLSTNQLTKELLEPESQFYIVESHSSPIGFIKLNFISNETIDPQLKGLEIARIYVLKDHQDKGIGQLMMNEIRKIATAKHLDYIWLGVWENNFKARAFYEKNGFSEFGKHVFLLGEDQQNDLLLWNLIES